LSFETLALFVTASTNMYTASDPMMPAMMMQA
jgi:hypothetical protein